MQQVYIFLIMMPLFSFGQIISFELEESWSIFDVQNIYTFGDFPPYIGEINYAVDAYKISYLTPDQNGDLVVASGAIFLPKDPICKLPILSWQHGTIVADFGAPSENIANSTIGVVSASHGYAVIMSDYLGLGSGEGFHNYCHSDTEASAVIDLIIEGGGFIQSMGLDTNGQIFLMGYSQGGHATMASVKVVELNYSDELIITASAPMAGPYSMSEAQAGMLNTVYPNPGYFPYIIFAYQNIYNNLYSDVNEVLKPGFSDLLSMYNGTYSMSDINDVIWSIADSIYGIQQNDFTPLDMIQENYYDSYENDENHPFRIALEANDLLDFIPNSPMRLIHCNGDNDVSYENSIMAFNAFSPFVNEELVLLDGGDFNHSECAKSSIISAKLFFDQLVDFCSETDLYELDGNKELIQSINMFGQVISPKEKYLVFKLYSDGSVDKRFSF